MEWIKPEYSRNRVQNAGRDIVFADTNSPEFDAAGPVFFNWRSAHAFPMQILLNLLRRKAKAIDNEALVVQRLKREISILMKIHREGNMSLSRMEDIAGCRAVVDTIDNVRQLHMALKKSRTKHHLSRERDYISTPKESGYRAIHLVYKYGGGKQEFQGMSVELQLRSKIQHSWATAVEVVGTFTKQALKASIGNAIWLNFFKFVSVEFAKLEGCPVEKRYEGVDTYLEMRKCIKELDISRRLPAFNVAAKALEERGRGYFLLLLDLEEKSIEVKRFRKSDMEDATEEYNILEQKTRGDPSKDVVLVSADSVRDLKRAYRNYFSDTKDFQRNIIEVHKANLNREKARSDIKK